MVEKNIEIKHYATEKGEENNFSEIINNIEHFVVDGEQMSKRESYLLKSKLRIYIEEEIVGS